MGDQSRDAPPGIHGDAPPGIHDVLCGSGKRSCFSHPLGPNRKDQLCQALLPQGQEVIDDPRYWHNRLQKVVHQLIAAVQLDTGVHIRIWNEKVWKDTNAWLSKNMAARGKSNIGSEDDLNIILDRWFNEAVEAWSAANNGGRGITFMLRLHHQHHPMKLPYRLNETEFFQNGGCKRQCPNPLIGGPPLFRQAEPLKAHLRFCMLNLDWERLSHDCLRQFQQQLGTTATPM